METSQLAALNSILAETIKRRASDLHLTVGKQPVVRIDDKLQPLSEAEVLTADFLKAVVKDILTDEQQEVLKKEKEIIFIYNWENKARFKINIFQQRGYWSISWRVIPVKVKTPLELGLTAIIDSLTKLKEGLVIITGPFSSGRTTTAVSLIEEINKNRAEHIITIEKPIEFIFTNKKSIVDQREVGRDTNSFLDALENCQEEDVDVLLVEEINSPKELSLILDIANSGALVIALMNTDSVIQTIEKILFSFQSFERERIQNLLASVLEGIVVQRLLPQVGGGLIMASEVLISTLAVKSIIREGKIRQLSSILQTSKSEGMITLDQSLADLVRRGKITGEEALGSATNKADFKSFLKNN